MIIHLALGVRHEARGVSKKKAMYRSFLMPFASRLMPALFRHNLQLQEAFVFRRERIGDFGFGAEPFVVDFKI